MRSDIDIKRDVEAELHLIHPLIFSETQKNRHCLTEIPKRIERSR